ncbi:MAG: hypothetical protein GX878_04820 [Firmicutes bacterium]|nr:hypothetical protein [Bacillota bacterium]
MKSSTPPGENYIAKWRSIAIAFSIPFRLKSGAAGLAAPGKGPEHALKLAVIPPEQSTAILRAACLA